MNRSELIGAVAAETHLSKGDAEKAVNATFDVIIKVLRDGDDVRLAGFGTFDVSERAAREGRNPQTGAAIKIAASRAVRFRGGKAVKEALNKPKPQRKGRAASKKDKSAAAS